MALTCSLPQAALYVTIPRAERQLKAVLLSKAWGCLAGPWELSQKCSYSSLETVIFVFQAQGLPWTDWESTLLGDRSPGRKG